MVNFKKVPSIQDSVNITKLIYKFVTVTNCCLKTEGAHFRRIRVKFVSFDMLPCQRFLLTRLPSWQLSSNCGVGSKKKGFSCATY